MTSEYLKYIKYMMKWPVDTTVWSEADIEKIINRLLLQMEYVKEKNTFDEKYYIKNYPWVNTLDITPLEHFFFEGFICSQGNGKNPNENLDINKYYEKTKHYSSFYVNPLFHHTFLENTYAIKDDIVDSFDEYERFVYSEDVKIIKLDTVENKYLYDDIRVLVHIHGYYVDLIEDILKRFKDTQINLKFIITTDTTDKKEIIID